MSLPPDKKKLAADVKEFLSTRRARITPEQAGLPVYGGNRRVEGLRREEVALLAGMSVDYYVRLERGNLSGASDAVLESLAHALQLNEAERTHLYDLARAQTPSGRRPAVTASRVRPTILRLLDSMAGVPAYVRNARFDIVASNTLGRALYAPVFDSPLFAQRGPVNTARYVFLDPASQDFWVDWTKGADDAVAFLRNETGRAPHDKALTDLIGELTTRSDEFAERWARHDVKFHRSGLKKLHHPLVGDLALPYEAMELPSDPGLRLNFYTPEPDSAEQEALGLLASWTTTTSTPAPAGND
ncbi:MULTISPECIES: helix-turn-helix transcriptional regulator [Streptomyces]|uniref:Helix-turn-helix transcriptional regulator n=1 Tax=Streptomyces caniscabiei TaxID=2746961 RepID=A0ABU4N3N6_9ACTN|nr:MULTISPECIES: helix-turn-helix transcriptional regulator [Streptomyces]MDX2948222.1 helix-turn-helix transcriptional regulator [Streptomyces caniscabiei]MDX2990925.1 helix-turn-helix transcriptional regulator [Streptomyces caniscabiei]MDX3015472.1 helix-turn-helix transcriptional regulator [Streptomyces caniscabiei]MDX3043160.1 helix-turn-helix transcriptional regulator [Streptomyces caniscabiei]